MFTQVIANEKLFNRKIFIKERWMKENYAKIFNDKKCDLKKKYLIALRKIDVCRTCISLSPYATNMCTMYI